MILNQAEVKEKVLLRGSVTKPLTPEQFDKFVRAEAAKIGKTIKDSGIKLD